MTPIVLIDKPSFSSTTRATLNFIHWSELYLTEMDSHLHNIL